MPKYYKKRSYRPRDKYSVEQQAGVLQIPTTATDVVTVVVPDTNIQGMRKVKHLTVSLAARDEAGAASDTCYWALVYVPQGTSVNPLNISGSSGFYEPNQFVMNCGVCDFSAGPCRFTSRVSRNLNSGDRICLIINGGSVAATRYFAYCVRYAVTLQ